MTVSATGSANLSACNSNCNGREIVGWFLASWTGAAFRLNRMWGAGDQWSSSCSSWPLLSLVRWQRWEILYPFSWFPLRCAGNVRRWNVAQRREVFLKNWWTRPGSRACFGWWCEVIRSGVCFMACVVSDQQKNGQMLMHNFDKDIWLLPQYNQQLKRKKRKRTGSKNIG